MTDTDTSTDLDDALLSACRTTVGDELRSLTYFTVEDYRLVYLREDLEHVESLEPFVTNERHGFAAQEAYTDPELGAYRATIRVFDDGYLTRVIAGDHGVFVTTDEMPIERFTEVAEATEDILERHA